VAIPILRRSRRKFDIALDCPFPLNTPSPYAKLICPTLPPIPQTVIIPRECDKCILATGMLRRADFHGEKKLGEEDGE